MSTARAEFQVFVKPIGAVCNLDCSYCYYLEKRALYTGPGSLRMSEDMLERYIIQHIAAWPSPVVQFSWHGGEPTLLGIPFFRKAVALQRKHLPPGRELLNGIQTNGTLLDENWGSFLSSENFRVGISLDGPAELHDACRLSRRHAPTHQQVMHGYRLLQRHHVHCDVLCVVNAFNAGHPLKVYRFFKDIGSRNLTFLPLVAKSRTGTAAPESVSGQAWGAFLCAVFDEWIRSDAGLINVQMFDEAARPLLGMEHSLCVLRPSCGELPVLEHNGDMYSCDHFVDRCHFLGNMHTISLTEALDSPMQQAFGENKRRSLPQSCRQCKWLAFCNGGCPKDRIVPSPSGGPPLNHLCAGYRRFFAHARPHLQKLVSYLHAGGTAGDYADWLQAKEAGQHAAVGRNSACPCGSGRKYKVCCLGKPFPGWSSKLHQPGS
jgi:uncharacterized protein